MIIDEKEKKFFLKQLSINSFLKQLKKKTLNAKKDGRNEKRNNNFDAFRPQQIKET